MSSRRGWVKPAGAQSSTAARFLSGKGQQDAALDATSLVELQQTAGNRAVVQLIADQQASLLTIQRQHSAGQSGIDPAYYDAGYRDGRAGNEPNPPGPLDPLDMAIYYQGYKNGHSDAEKTQTSASPSESSNIETAEQGPLPQPDFLNWTPTKQKDLPPIKPVNFEPIVAGPPVSKAYEEGVQAAWNHDVPRRDVPWSDRVDYAAGYESVLRQMEQGLTGPNGGTEASQKGESGEEHPNEGIEAAKTIGGHIVDESAPELVKHYAGKHIPHVPYAGVIEMATELKSDTPMRGESEMTHEEVIEANRAFANGAREELQAAMAAHIKDPLEEEQDASVPDATVR